MNVSLTDKLVSYDSIEETLKSLSEEENEADAVNDESDKFVPAAVAREAKSLQAEEKTLKAALKKETDALHLKMKATIEALSDAQVHELLERKWITPLCEELHRLPE